MYYNKSLKCATVLFFFIIEQKKSKWCQVLKDGKIGENGRKVKWESMDGGRRRWRDGIIARVTAK